MTTNTDRAQVAAIPLREAVTKASAPAVAHAIAAQIIATYGKDAHTMAAMVSDEVSRLSRIEGAVAAARDGMGAGV